MAEQTFRSPNFFEREIDLSSPTVEGPEGIPAAIIGTSDKGPAFTPVTVRDFTQFVSIFGDLNYKKMAPYAVKQFLENKRSLTFLRVLGAGANSQPADVYETMDFGVVKNAGFFVSSSYDNTSNLDNGGTFFIQSEIEEQVNTSYSSPQLTENDSFTDSKGNVISAKIFTAEDTRIIIRSKSDALTHANLTTSDLTFSSPTSNDTFKLIVSSSTGKDFSNDDGLPGINVFTASLNPSSPNYVGKILNTDPTKFSTEKHFLHLHFPVDNAVAKINGVSVLSGSSGISKNSVSFRNLFGLYKTRYTTPKSPVFISQPFGKYEYDLFHFEAIDDGSYANNLYKISISNIKTSVDETNLYGSFTVQVRDFYDNDFNPNVIEQFNECNLNPDSANFIGNVIGDRKLSYTFDTNNPAEKRVTASGTYDNKSRYVRVVVNKNVIEKKVPNNSLPFGFRSPLLLKTSNINKCSGNTGGGRLSKNIPAILPPIPFRTKVTRNDVSTDDEYNSGVLEQSTSQLYWGVQFERISDSNPLDANTSVEPNLIIENFTKFSGIEKMGALLSQQDADEVNNNKFTLARVTFKETNLTDIDESASQHMLTARYVRQGVVNPGDYTVNGKITLASLVNATDLNYSSLPYTVSAASNFNRFSVYAKYTTFMYGGFDGVNILDKDATYLNDRSTSFDLGGGANQDHVSPGFEVSSTNHSGKQTTNNGVISYRTAVDIMTNPLSTINNILALPGIREPYITDYAAQKCRDYGFSMYVMDIPSYADDGKIIYDDSAAKPNIERTAATFENRSIDNNYVATYFPDIYVEDTKNKRRPKVPASVAAISALGYNDRAARPWFAPAGFDRGSLGFVTNVGVRLNVSDRDRLYDARINPIATFPRQGFVIYGQKTLQIKKSSLDRVNVRRLLLEVKRIISGIATNLIFEQNTPAVRNKFVADAALQLGLIQAQSGLEAFQVVMNESNNTQDDIDNNRLRGRIVVVPTRVIEFIAMDFIITNSGVEFA